MKKELKPRSVKTILGDKAWIYVNQGSIEVYVSQEGNKTMAVRITKRQLESILNNDV